MKYLFIVLAFLASTHAYSQSISLNYFNKRILNSTFSSSNDAKTWPSANNRKELIIIQNESYYLENKDNLKSRNIFPDFPVPYNRYYIQASINLNSDIPSGICFSFDHDGLQGYIIEINTNKEFRIRKISPEGIYQFMTGSNKNNSWRKFKYLQKNDGGNDISIVVSDNLFEVYLNSEFAFSFKDNPIHTEMNFGIYLNPGSKLQVNHIAYWVNENEKPLESKKTNYIASDSFSSNNPDAGKYLDKIVKLNNELTAVIASMEEYKKMLEECRNDNIELNDYISNNLNTELQQQVKYLDKKVEELEARVIDLQSENSTLQEFKEHYVNENKDQDIVNFLYDELHKLEKENAELKKRIKELQ